MKPRPVYDELRMVAAALPRSAYAKVLRAVSLLTTASAMHGHAKARELRARAAKVVRSLPPALRVLAREWLAYYAPRPLKAPKFTRRK